MISQPAQHRHPKVQVREKQVSERRLVTAKEQTDSDSWDKKKHWATTVQSLRLSILHEAEQWALQFREQRALLPL